MKQTVAGPVFVAMLALIVLVIPLASGAAKPQAPHTSLFSLR